MKIFSVLIFLIWAMSCANESSRNDPGYLKVDMDYLVRDLGLNKRIIFRSNDGIMYGTDGDVDIEIDANQLAKITSYGIGIEEEKGVYEFKNDAYITVTTKSNKVVFDVKRKGHVYFIFYKSGPEYFEKLSPFRGLVPID